MSLTDLRCHRGVPLGMQLGDLFLEKIHPAAAGPLAEDREQGVWRGPLGVAKGADQQQRRIAHCRREELEQPGWPRPRSARAM